MAMEKVSMSLDAGVLAKAREQVGGRGLSAYVNEAVDRQLRRDALDEFLAFMREKNGPVPEEEMAKVRRLWPGPNDPDPATPTR